MVYIVRYTYCGETYRLLETFTRERDAIETVQAMRARRWHAWYEVA